MNDTNKNALSTREEQLRYWSHRFGLSMEELDRIWRLYFVLYPMPGSEQQVASEASS